MSEPMSEAVFLRLTALEQSQALLRRAQFLDASSRARHAAAMDRHQAQLDLHEAMHQEHVTHMAHLETLLERQQVLQASLVQMMGTMDARMAQNEAMLQRLIDSQRHRNGH